MGRSETPLAGGDRLLIAFAEELRRLRQQAGSPSYRDLAKRAHYSAAALSQAANGRALPTLAVTLAFVNSCGGDSEEWTRRWTEVAAKFAVNAGNGVGSPGATDVGAVTGPWMPADISDGATAQPTAAAPPIRDGNRVGSVQQGRADPTRPRTRRRRTRLLAVSLLVVPVALVGGFMAMKHAAVHCGGPGEPDPVADGCDPNRAGCGPDAVTMLSTAVHFPASEMSGNVELRYSPHCRAAWVRFTPSDDWHPGPGVVVTVWTIRPADQASQEYTVEFGGESIIGNILLTKRGCIVAEATMKRGSDTSPVATTACWTFAP